MNPSYPVYIISKGRWESRLTARALESIGVPYSIVVEPQERDAYAAVIDPAKVLTLPESRAGIDPRAQLGMGSFRVYRGRSPLDTRRQYQRLL